MVDFRPFRGLRYNSKVVGDLASTLCPPYDLIAPELQQSLYGLSPYNVVRLEEGERLESDDAATNRYTRAAALFDQWLRQEVLVREQEACFYLLRQAYRFRGHQKARLGLMGCVRLEEYDRRAVLPHEYTQAPPVQDRVALMEACLANFSPIMGLYRDSSGLLSPVIREVMAQGPIVHIRDSGEQELTLWAVAARDLREAVGKFFAQRVVYLADGHHRYEAALKFRDIQLSQAASLAHTDAAGNFVMMTLIGFDDAGLMVLPYHRVLEGLAAPVVTQLMKRLHQLFEVRPVAGAGNGGAEGLLEQVAHSGKERQTIGLVGREDESRRLLTLRPEVDRDSWGPLAISEAWILEEQVLKPVLGRRLTEHLSYVHDHHLAVEQVASGQRQMAFLFNPLPMAQFESVVGEGRRLPPKSTFFYPKLPTGLVINQLDGIL
jgi:uncharacterized protein (DUF1015 family)